MYLGETERLLRESERERDRQTDRQTERERAEKHDKVVYRGWTLKSTIGNTR